jgi:hypothetical protein
MVARADIGRRKGLLRDEKRAQVPQGLKELTIAGLRILKGLCGECIGRYLLSYDTKSRNVQGAATFHPQNVGVVEIQ